MKGKPIVECRNCDNLETHKDPDGLQIRCGRGHYDSPEYINGKDTGRRIPQYYSALALRSGNVGIWRATKKCGSDYEVVPESTKSYRNRINS